MVSRWRNKQNVQIINVQVKTVAIYASLRNTPATFNGHDVLILIWAVHLRATIRYVLTMASGKRLRDEVGTEVFDSDTVLSSRLRRAYLECEREASWRTATKKINTARRYQT